MTSEKTNPEKTEKAEVVTLKSQGPNLPLGIATQDGSLSKAITPRKWRMKEEKELGAKRDEYKGESIAKYVSVVLASMYSKIGGYDFDAIDDFNRRLIHISQMALGDVFYAYFWLRYTALGSVLKVDMTCPNCNNQFDFEGDIESLEIKTAATLQESMWDYELRDPIQVRGEDCLGFQMGAARWNAIEVQDSAGAMDTGAAKSGIITGSIHKILGQEQSIILTEDELDEMSKFDIEKLTAEIDKKSVGPDMSLNGKCPKCKRPFMSSIDWRYDNFFGISSH